MCYNARSTRLIICIIDIIYTVAKIVLTSPLKMMIIVCDKVKVGSTCFSCAWFRR